MARVAMDLKEGGRKFEASDNLPKYFEDIKKIEPLSREREWELARRVQEGDELALQELVRANVKFVVSMANRFMHLGTPIDDLISEGNLGMIEAAKRFKPWESDKKNVKFITYAQMWIHKYCNDAPRKHRTVLIPTNQDYEIYKRRKRGEEVDTRTVQLDKPVGDDGDVTLGDMLLKTEERSSIDNGDHAKHWVQILVKDAKLNEYEIKLMWMMFGIDRGGEEMKVKDIAKELGISVEEVTTTVRQARNRLRKASLKYPMHEVF